MRFGIFADVHANLEALDVVFKALEIEKVDQIICLGDLVGYGPNPNLCVEKVISISDIVVAGNHDWAATGRISTENFNRYAREAIEWTHKVLEPGAVEKLNHLPLIKDNGMITVVHDTPEAPGEWNYIASDEDIFRNLRSITTQFCFIGHSHIPAIYILEQSGDMILQKAKDLTIEQDKLYLINVGSVGQPRDGDARTAYAILDTDKNTFQLKRPDYPIERVQKKMTDKGLPEFLIERLAYGQ